MEQTRSAEQSCVLQQACEDYLRELFIRESACSDLPDPTFSPSFEREIKRLISRTRNNRFHRMTGSAKVILVAAIIALLMALTVTAAQLFGIGFSQGEGGMMKLIMNGPLSGQYNPELEIGYMAEGFVLTEKEQLSRKMITYIYEDAFSRNVQIMKSTYINDYSADTDRHVWTQRVNNGITYYWGEGISSNEDDMIAWADSETKCFYTIHGRGVDIETLFTIAQTVK